MAYIEAVTAGTGIILFLLMLSSINILSTYGIDFGKMREVPKRRNAVYIAVSVLILTAIEIILLDGDDGEEIAWRVFVVFGIPLCVYLYLAVFAMCEWMIARRRSFGGER